LRGFLGLTGYYRRFIKGYGLLTKPLNSLLSKKTFQWSPEAQQAFDKVKMTMTQTPVLALPNFQEPVAELKGGPCGPRTTLSFGEMSNSDSVFWPENFMGCGLLAKTISL